MNAAEAITQILADALGTAAGTAAAAYDFAMWAQSVAATVLAGEVAALTGVAPAEAHHCLLTVPDNMLMLLDSPQGWTVLAGFIAGDLGVAAPNYKPKIH